LFAARTSARALTAALRRRSRAHKTLCADVRTPRGQMAAEANVGRWSAILTFQSDRDDDVSRPKISKLTRVISMQNLVCCDHCCVDATRCEARRGRATARSRSRPRVPRDPSEGLPSYQETSPPTAGDIRTSRGSFRHSAKSQFANPDFHPVIPETCSS
jgi:hypothetical protein